jgi:hypothetical protein
MESMDKKISMKRVSAAYCWAAYLVALALTGGLDVALKSYAPTLGPLWKGLALNAFATAVVWAFSLGASNTSVYDPVRARSPSRAGCLMGTRKAGQCRFLPVGDARKECRANSMCPCVMLANGLFRSPPLGRPARAGPIGRASPAVAQERDGSPAQLSLREPWKRAP